LLSVEAWAHITRLLLAENALIKEIAPPE